MQLGVGGTPAIAGCGVPLWLVLKATTATTAARAASTTRATGANWIIAALGLLVVLAACAPGLRSDANSTLADGRKMTAAERADLRAVLRGEILREERPFYGDAVEVRRGSVSGEPLPEALEGARGINLHMPGQSDIEAIAEAVTLAAGIPVNIRTRYVLPDGEIVSVPIGARMAVSYEGPLSAFLDRIGARMDVAWSHDGTVVTIDRMVVRERRVPLPASRSSLRTQVGGATGTAEGNVALSLEREQVQDPWQELRDRLAPVTPPPAYVTLSPGTGRVSVFGPPSVQARAGAIIDDVVEIYSTRIGLEIGIYFLDSDKSDEFGIGVSGAEGGLGTLIGRPVDLSATAGAGVGSGLGGGSLTLSRGDATVDFQALARDRSVVDYRLASSIVQSGVVAPISITRRETYIAKVTRSLSGESGELQTEIENAEVVSGISVHALPRLVDTGQIQLALTVLQNELAGGEVRQERVDGVPVGLPELDQRVIQHDSLLAPGETLVLSGYEQDVAVAEDTGLGPLARIGVGGKSARSVRKIRMVVLVRPSLVPLGAG